VAGTPEQAWQEFRQVLAATISCLGPAKVVRSRNLVEGASWSLNGPGGHLVTRTRGDRPPPALHAEMLFRCVQEDDAPRAQRWRVTTTAYRYHMVQAGRDVVSWHWHPAGSSPVTWPHQHLGAATVSSDGVITPRSHLPTGRITLEDVVHFMIADLGALPARDDWHHALHASRSWFYDRASWLGPIPSSQD
jgi:hypothetical protein